MAKNDHFFTATMLHIKFDLTCRDCRKILPYTYCFKKILSSEAKCISILQVYLKENIWEILQVMLTFWLYAIVTEKANRLGKMTLSSISAGQYHWTTLINMFPSTLFGGKLNMLNSIASRYSTTVRREPVYMVWGCGKMRVASVP